MPELLRMPEVAANTTEAVLLSWPVAENVPFASRETIATVETAKAVVDVEAEAAGVILRTLVAEGTEVAVGEPIALIAAKGEVVTDIDAALAALGETADVKGARALDVPEADPMPVAPAPVSASELPAQPTRLFASPLARRMAREANLPLGEIAGSGPSGRIVRRDIEAALRRRASAESPVARAVRAEQPNVPAGAALDGPAEPAAPFTDVQASRQRKLIAARLTESKLTTPHFYLRGTARVDALLAMRAELNEGNRARISVTDLLIKAIARTHLFVPALNVNYLGDVIRHFTSVDISIAIATAHGLVTPVIRNAQVLSATEIAEASTSFAVRARSQQLRQHELEGGSITISNLGMRGVDEFAAIINPPQAAILAVGAAMQKPLVRNGKVIAATTMTMTLSVDHRAVDGAEAADWMATLSELLEHPVRILA